jgi:hypothetical protein
MILNENSTNGFGTVRKNRQEMPQIGEKLERGEWAIRSSNKMMAMKYYDKKDVWMLTTVHSDNVVETKKIDYKTKKPKIKPACIVDYNNLMGTVDKIDMILNSINSLRKSIKWYKKYFFHLLDLSIYNSYVIYKNTTKKKISFPEFHLKLIKGILKHYGTRNTTQYNRNSSEELLVRLIERHFPSFCIQKEGTKSVARRRCVVCLKHDTRTDTRYECQKCDVGLCIVPCFELYHTKRQF